MAEMLPSKRPIIFCMDKGEYTQQHECDCDCDCDCDCACASICPSDVTLPSDSTLWRVAPYVKQPLNNDYTAFLAPYCSTGPAVLNTPARRVIEIFATPIRISDAPALLPDIEPDEVKNTAHKLTTLGLLTPAIDPYITSHRPQSVTQLTAWLHLTDRCNLRCDYCYLPHRHADLSVETGQAAIAATLRSAVKHGFKQVKLKYAGGEPLLRLHLLSELQPYAQKLADQSDLILGGVVLSNGTLLTPESISLLQAMNLRLMISLDGLGEVHDNQRRYASGRGSAADVLDSVELALEYGLIPSISITVSQRTVAGLPELLDWVLARDLPFSLNFYRANNLSVHKKDLEIEQSTITRGMLAAFDVLRTRLPNRNLLASLVDRANLAVTHDRTCGVGQNYLVFDPNGLVSKCQMQIGDAVSSVRADDPLNDVRSASSGIQNLSVEQKDGCCDCQWRFWCAGGCPLETYRVTGRYDTKSPNCAIYQDLFPAALNLEGLRLLKQSAKSV